MAQYFNNNDKPRAAAAAAAAPTSCPSCAAQTIASTAKVPTVDSYWRCMRCGEVWSPARRIAPSTRRW